MSTVCGLSSILNVIICNTEEERAEEQARAFALFNNEREQQQDEGYKDRYQRHRMS